MAPEKPTQNNKILLEFSNPLTPLFPNPEYGGLIKTVARNFILVNNLRLVMSVPPEIP